MISHAPAVLLALAPRALPAYEEKVLNYIHTQKVPGKAMVALSAAGLAIGLTPPGLLARLALLGVLGAAAVNFRSLTVEVDDNEVSMRFGGGPIKKAFRLIDIESAYTTRTTPFHGWGVHWIGVGWLYNIWGLDAVELCFKSGQRAFIGTDDPENLAAAINSRVKPLEPLESEAR